MCTWQLKVGESFPNLTETTAFLLADLAKATGGTKIIETVPNFDGSYEVSIQGTLVTDSHRVGTRIVKLIRQAGGPRLRLQQVSHRRKEGGYHCRC